jgi:hypothetical protein
MDSAIKIQLNNYFDIEKYKDYRCMDGKAFLDKYQHLGFTFRNFLEIRFYRKEDLNTQLALILGELQKPFLLINLLNKELHPLNISEIDFFNLTEFIIFDQNFEYLFVVNTNRKVTFLTEKLILFAETKITINDDLLYFNNIRLMFTLSSKKHV